MTDLTGEVITTGRRNAPANSFVKRKIDVSFTLNQGTFGGGTNTAKVTGLRVGAYIDKVGDPGFATVQVVIFGMPLSMMNQLSTLAIPYPSIAPNSILVEAGDDVNGMATVFIGTVQQAWADINQAPDAPFNVVAQNGILPATRPVQPISFSGATDVVTVMQGLASTMNLTFENNGVEGIMLSTPYYPGTAWQQAQACAKAAGINWTIDDGKLAIWPKGGYRSSIQTAIIAPETGLKGYPSYTQLGVSVESIFNPSLVYGARIDLRSSLTPANGLWTVFHVTHNLESEDPNGSWFSVIEALNFGRPE